MLRLSNEELARALRARQLVGPEVLTHTLREAERTGQTLAQLLVLNEHLSPEQLDTVVADLATEATRQPNPDPASARPSRLPEPFAFVKRLGQGAMGEVVLAHDNRLGGRAVAVKAILQERADPESLRRFAREARATAAISHPNVIRIHRLTGGERNETLLVMEYVEGETLDDRLRTSGPLSESEAAALGARLADGLAAAHDAGVLHRDIKPANILIEDATGRPVLTDFGLARLRGASSLTNTGQILGSPVYMSPEQANAEGVDERSDIYSLGATLYKLVCGAPPYADRGSVHVILRDLARGREPARPTDLRPDLDPAFEAILLRAMASRPRDRFGSARDLAGVLRDYEPATEAVSSPERRGSAVLGTVALLILLGLGIGLSLFSDGKQKEDERVPSERRPHEEEKEEEETVAEETEEKPDPGEASQKPARDWRPFLPAEPDAASLKASMAAAILSEDEHRIQTLGLDATLRACRQAHHLRTPEAVPFLLRLVTSVAESPNNVRLEEGGRSVRKNSNEGSEYRLLRSWWTMEAVEALVATARHSEQTRTALRKGARRAIEQKQSPGPIAPTKLGWIIYILARAGDGPDLCEATQKATRAAVRRSSMAERYGLLAACALRSNGKNRWQYLFEDVAELELRQASTWKWDVAFATAVRDWHLGKESDLTFGLANKDLIRRLLAPCLSEGEQMLPAPTLKSLLLGRPDDATRPWWPFLRTLAVAALCRTAERDGRPLPKRFREILEKVKGQLEKESGKGLVPRAIQKPLIDALDRHLVAGG